MGSFLNSANEKFSEEMVNFWPVVESCGLEVWNRWSCSFEKVGASEKTECHLGNLVSLKDHCDFILCLPGQHNEPS